MWGGGGGEKKAVMELKMGSSWALVVNILSYTFMIRSAAARQDQTPSYEELGEMKKILHFSDYILCCVPFLPKPPNLDAHTFAHFKSFCLLKWLFS